MSSPLTPKTNLSAAMFGVTKTFKPLNVPAKYGPLIALNEAALNPSQSVKIGKTDEAINIYVGATLIFIIIRYIIMRITSPLIFIRD